MHFPKFLRVAIVPKLAIFDVNYTDKGELLVTGGSDAALLKFMSKALNFQYEMLAPKDGGWGNLVNGSWTGTIGMIVEGRADLAIGKIAITKDRALATDYSYPYDIERLTFATKLPGNVPKAAAFVWPFTWQLWISIFSLLIFMPLLYRLVLRRYSFQRLAIEIFGSVLRQPLYLKMTSTKGRLLTFGWLLGSMFISFSYTALMLAFLTVPLRRRAVEDIQELGKAVVEDTFRCMTFRGDSHQEMLARSTQPLLAKVGEIIAKNDWKVKPLKAEVSKVLSDGKTAVLAPSFFFRHQMQDEVFISKDSFSILTRSIFFRKDFCCGDEIDKYIYRVWNSGLYHKYLNDQLFKARLLLKFKTVSDDGIKSLTIEDLSGAFFLFFIGILLSFCGLLYEFFHYNMYNKKGKIRKAKVPTRKPLKAVIRY